MARIAGVDLPTNKRGLIGLTYIYGIGRSRSTKILEKAGVDVSTRVKDWNDEELSNIRAIINGGEFKVEGIRHRNSLPLRGQRTKNNSRTRKGKRKTVANKKKA
jgi:small subunit ribosomal protein S13